jgi:hypothetical protein
VGRLPPPSTSARYDEGGLDDQVAADNAILGGGLIVGCIEKVSLAHAITRPSEVIDFGRCIMCGWGRVISRAKDPTWGKGGDKAVSCSGIARMVDALGSYEFLGLDEIIDTPRVASDPGEPKIDEAGYPNP